MFQDVVDLNTPLKLQEEILEVVKQVTYVSSCVSSGGCLSMHGSRKLESLLLIYVSHGVRKVYV